jgi:DNA-binding NtrC family response regulator
MLKKILIVEDEFIVADNLQRLLESAGYEVTGIVDSYERALDLVNKKRPDLVLLDIRLNGKLTGIDLAARLKEQHIAFVYLSANSNQKTLAEAKATEPYGFLVKPFRKKDVLVALDIAFYRHENSFESKLRRQLQLENKLELLAQDPAGFPDKLLNLATTLQSFLPFDYASFSMRKYNDSSFSNLHLLRVGYDEYQVIGIKELQTITGLTLNELTAFQVAAGQETYSNYFNGESFKKLCAANPLKSLLAKTFDLESHLEFLLPSAKNILFTIDLYCKRKDGYNNEHLSLLGRLNASLLRILEESCLDGVNPVLEKAQHDNTRNTQGKNDYVGIVGASSQLFEVMDLVSQVAPLETSVLILGDSGTGKERIADNIYHLSVRKDKPFIKVNCSALPPTLIESELFGHEKGSFTGATERKIGKFEQASGGTLFLDEIGEIPVNMQAKLLRVLQEREIDRIGGDAPVKVNIRIITATNRNLELEIAEGRFRLDLYFRLNVFPIFIPPLRERVDDILPLALFFAENCCKRMNKRFTGMSASMMNELQSYSWPGNIRQLENVIEQSVILNDGQSGLTLKRPLGTPGTPTLNSKNYSTANQAFTQLKTLEDIKQIQNETEKDYLLSILRQTKGKVRGPGGAAELLNLKPTTLESRLIKLGIKKDELLR